MGTPERSTTVVTAHWDWVLWRYHREFLAELENRGHRVVIACPSGRYTAELEEMGLHHRRWRVTRRGLSPFSEVAALRRLVRLYRQERPVVAWHLTVKPSLYGSIAARRAGVPQVVNTYTGLGFLFGSQWMARAARRVLRPIARRALRATNVHSIVLNPEDHDRLAAEGWITPDRTRLIPSSGVDTETYRPPPSPPARPYRVLMAARLLEDKGVDTYADAARLLHADPGGIEFLLAGVPDPGNPRSVTSMQLEQWRDQGHVRLLGHVDDMPTLLRSVHAAVLPTRYNEGVPSFLLEAAATGLPLVATGMPGCRIVVRHLETGLIVQPGDSDALAAAVRRLFVDEVARERMGARARQLVLDRFAVEKVVADYLRLHDDVRSIRR